jgi:uncharacterized membrane protein YdjX (TVP38/TMEM64 family)
VAAANEAETAGRPASWTRYLPLAILALAMAAVFATGGHKVLSLETIVAYRDKLQAFVHEYGPMAVIAYSAFYVAVVALSIPGGVFMTILGGFLFGWLFGGAIASVSATLGAVLVFLIARTSVGDILARKAGPRLQKFADGFREDAFSYLLFLRFLPIMPFWMTNLAPALFGVRVETFAFATMIGILPATFTFATAGAGLDSVIAAQKASFEACKASGRADCAFDLNVWSLLTPQIIAAFAALGIMALIPVAVRHWRRRKGSGSEPASAEEPSTAGPGRPNA